ncbi:DUF5959 family protein [Spirillospora sp. CA-253888]
MAEHDPIDLIHLDYAVGGSSLLVRVTGQDGTTHDGLPILAGDLQITSTLVSGGRPTAIFPEDLDDWERTLDVLASGRSAVWREDQRATEIHLLLDEEDHYTVVSVRDLMGALVTVDLCMELPDDWIADHRARLAQVRARWTA